MERKGAGRWMAIWILLLVLLFGVLPGGRQAARRALPEGLRRAGAWMEAFADTLQSEGGIWGAVQSMGSGWKFWEQNPE